MGTRLFCQEKVFVPCAISKNETGNAEAAGPGARRSPGHSSARHPHTRTAPTRVRGDDHAAVTLCPILPKMFTYARISPSSETGCILEIEQPTECAGRCPRRRLRLGVLRCTSLCLGASGWYVCEAGENMVMEGRVPNRVGKTFLLRRPMPFQLEKESRRGRAGLRAVTLSSAPILYCYFKLS